MCNSRSCLPSPASPNWAETRSPTASPDRRTKHRKRGRGCTVRRYGTIDHCGPVSRPAVCWRREATTHPTLTEETDMLVLTRKIGEEILIDGTIRVTITAI